MLLDDTTKKFRIKLGEAIATTQVHCSVDYTDLVGEVPTAHNIALDTNGVTLIDLLSAPAVDTVRMLTEMSLTNNDTIAHNIFMYVEIGGVDYLLKSFLFGVGAIIYYNRYTGWSTPTRLMRSEVAVGASRTILDSDRGCVLVVNTGGGNIVLTVPETFGASTEEFIFWVRRAIADVSAGTITINKQTGGTFVAQITDLANGKSIPTLEICANGTDVIRANYTV